MWPVPFELIFFFVSHHSAALFRSISLDENGTKPLGVHFSPLVSGEVKRLTVTEHMEAGGRLSHV